MNTRYKNRASTNVNQQQLIDNQNKVQSQNQPIVNPPDTPPTPQPIAKAGDAVIGVNGKRFVQANNIDGTTTVT